MSDAIDPLTVLTPREREIASLIANALPNRLIAQLLGIGDDTVRSHCENIATKLRLDPVLDRRVAIALFVIGRAPLSTFREYRGASRAPIMETSATSCGVVSPTVPEKRCPRV